MADNNKNQEEDIKISEKSVPVPEQERSFERQFEKRPIPERKETKKEEEIVSEELKREIEIMELDENLKKLAEQKANKISFLADDDKLKKLLEVAKEKGVVFAVHMAKKMNEPFLLDLLHDTLAREGYYKDFIK